MPFVLVTYAKAAGSRAIMGQETIHIIHLDSTYPIARHPIACSVTAQCPSLTKNGYPISAESIGKGAVQGISMAFAIKFDLAKIVTGQAGCPAVTDPFRAVELMKPITIWNRRTVITKSPRFVAMIVEDPAPQSAPGIIRAKWL
jgi:hypothetical protein